MSQNVVTASGPFAMQASQNADPKKWGAEILDIHAQMVIVLQAYELDGRKCAPNAGTLLGALGDADGNYCHMGFYRQDDAPGIQFNIQLAAGQGKKGKPLHGITLHLHDGNPRDLGALTFPELAQQFRSLVTGMVWHRLDMMPNPKARDMLEGVLAHFAKGVNGDFAALTAPQSAIAPPRQS